MAVAIPAAIGVAGVVAGGGTSALGYVTGIFGMFAGSVGILGFLDSKFGFLNTDLMGSVVRMQVGLSGPNASGMDGDLSDIRLYDDFGEKIGEKFDPGFVEDGALSKDLLVQSHQQASYGLFTAHDDAICLAYITIVWPDGQKLGWVGDWGKECDDGATW